MPQHSFPRETFKPFPFSQKMHHMCHMNFK